MRHLGRGDCIYCAFVNMERSFGGVAINTLLEVGGVYLEHTTLRVHSETTTSNRCVTGMSSNNYFFTVRIN